MFTLTLGFVIWFVGGRLGWVALRDKLYLIPAGRLVYLLAFIICCVGAYLVAEGLVQFIK